jgi:hypothetical protein
VAFLVEFGSKHVCDRFADNLLGRQTEPIEMGEIRKPTDAVVIPIRDHGGVARAALGQILNW